MVKCEGCSGREYIAKELFTEICGQDFEMIKHTNFKHWSAHQFALCSSENIVDELKCGIAAL